MILARSAHSTVVITITATVTSKTGTTNGKLKTADLLDSLISNKKMVGSDNNSKTGLKTWFKLTTSTVLESILFQKFPRISGASLLNPLVFSKWESASMATQLT